MFSTSQANPSTPAFISKLWHMVSNPKSDNLICWSQDGTSFIIKNNARFSSELLPMYYKHNNLASFIRQLNKYGFHKVMFVESSNNSDREFEFAHPDFVKDCPELLLKIKRKLSNSTKETVFKGESKLVTKLLQNVQLLQAKQNVFESKLKVMKSENDALWKELSILRQKHHKQQKIVNKLVQFFVILMQQTRGVNVNKFVPLMLKDGRPCLMAIKDSDRNQTPLICEVETNDIQGVNTLNNGTPTTLASASPNSDAGKEVINNLISSVNNGELVTVNVPSTSSENEILLNGSLSTCSAPSSDFVLPAVQEVTLLDNKQLNIENPITYNFTVPENKLVVIDDKTSLSSDKKSLKRKKSSSLNKKDCLLMVPELSNHSKSKEEKDALVMSLEFDDMVPDADADTDADALNPDDCTVFVLSPSSETNSSAISSSTESNNKELISPVEETLTNNDTSIVTSGNNSIMNKEDMNNHLDMIQNDLDVLKDILQTENLSLDSSTLMGLFNANDPLSLNLPEFNKNSGSNQNDINNENQIIAYSPSGNFIDFSDIFDDETEDFANVTLPSPKELSTPMAENDSSLSSENKRLKK